MAFVPKLPDTKVQFGWPSKAFLVRHTPATRGCDIDCAIPLRGRRGAMAIAVTRPANTVWAPIAQCVQNSGKRWPCWDQSTASFHLNGIRY